MEDTERHTGACLRRRVLIKLIAMFGEEYWLTPQPTCQRRTKETWRWHLIARRLSSCAKDWLCVHPGVKGMADANLSSPFPGTGQDQAPLPGREGTGGPLKMHHDPFYLPGQRNTNTPWISFPGLMPEWDLSAKHSFRGQGFRGSSIGHMLISWSS